MRTLVVVALCASAACCGTAAGTFSGGVFEDARVRYQAGEPGAGWERVSFEQADVAWIHSETAASLLVNSHCEGVQDAPLESLTNELLMGTTEREIVSQEKLPWSRREALETIAVAKLDGVPRRFALFVGKKDGCVYDIVLASPVDAFDDARTAYEAVKARFDAGPRKDRS
jgi:hypothetical protein